MQLFCDAITGVNTRGNCVITHNEYLIKENLNLLNMDERKQSCRTSFRYEQLNFIDFSINWRTNDRKQIQ